MNRAVVFDVNFGAGLGHDTLDRLATRSDECANLFRINLQRLDPRRVFTEVSARFVDCFRHFGQNLRARFFRAHGRFGHDFVADAGKFEIELETSDAGFGSTDFVIHVPEMIFRTENVGEELVTFERTVLRVLGNEAAANTCDRRFDRNARVHQRQHAAANAGHRT